MFPRLTRLSPGGSPISTRAIASALRQRDPGATLRASLRDRLGAAEVSLHRSGREALRVAFGQLSSRSARHEIVVPAYCCYSIPAAAVAAGLRVRLVDVDLSGRLDAASLARLPLERCAALVVGNLFGVPEPIGEILALAREAEVAVVDDAAQALGARTPDGPAGGRGTLGILSFGRGKPLSALGGGALVWSDATDALVSPELPASRPRSAAFRAIGYDVARQPLVFRMLSAIPALGVGETVYDPDFAQGGISGDSIALASALLPELDEMNRDRAKRAEMIASRLQHETHFAPLLAPPQCEAIHPRLGVVAPTTAARDAALHALEPLGATRMYPDSLDRVSELRPQLVEVGDYPGARAFCSRLLTLPTHAGSSRRHIDVLVKVLAGLA